ncbi:MAG: mandelate racemase/muconate lactonizing enzyme family protein [Deltaproteobacteria bacterium]|nr:mandelate racemase/muconate lactonizing enzyme family protein [Deltaproteobacteria bacterium]
MSLRSLRTFRPKVQPNVVIVELVDEDGAVGIGETFFGAGAVDAYLHEVAAPLLFDAAHEPTPNAVAQTLRSYVGYQGSGAETRGNSAVDLAAWDLLAKRAGQPLAKLLGGTFRPSAPVYNTCAGPGYVSKGTRQHTSNWGLGDADDQLQDLARFLTKPGELARELLDEGIKAMKIWPFDAAAEASHGTAISSRELAAGCALIDEIRDNVADEMDIMIELHGLWNLPAAVKICTALEPYDLTWVEDPIRPDATDALAALRSQTSVPLAVGETLSGRRAYLPLLAAGAIDHAIIDLTWTGGLSEAVKVASLADSFAVAAAPHDCTGPIALTAGVHLSVSQPNIAIQETVRAFYRGWYTAVATGLPEISDGHIYLSERPGLGVELHDDLAHRSDVIVRTSNREDLQ